VNGAGGRAMSRALAAIAVVAMACFSGQRASAQAAVRPDITGVWLPDGRRNAGQWPKDPPFTDAMKGAREAWARKAMPIDLEIDDENTSCMPGTMPGIMMGIAQYPFEIVTTPSQVVLLTEIYGLVRRIHLDGRRAPPELLPSRMGFSTGRWEADALVVETTHVQPQPERSNRPASGALRIVERFSLEPGGPTGKSLRNEITVYDAAVYKEPITVRMYYKWAPDVSVGEYLCQQDIWDQHMDGYRSEIPWRK
jgi:hypothetical protein